MYSPLVFIGIASVVAALHMIAPDHWLPLTALSNKRGYEQTRVLKISALLGFLHGSTTVILSLFALFLGVSIFGFSGLKEVSIIVLIGVALYILFNTLRERKGSKNVENTSLLVSILPDPVLLPIIIASYTLGKTEIAVISLTFIIVSILALTVVIIIVMAGIAKSLSKLKPTTMDEVVVVALVLTAVYIYFFG
jgi:hypothetical protein